jgi:hypothetical protein
MRRIDLSGIKKGDSVYVVSPDTRNKPYEATVKTVGRKYITIDNGWNSKYDKETGFNIELSAWRIYPSKREYEVEQERYEMLKYISRNIDRADLSCAEIRTIYNIIKSSIERDGKKPL